MVKPAEEKKSLSSHIFFRPFTCSVLLFTDSLLHTPNNTLLTTHSQQHTPTHTLLPNNTPHFAITPSPHLPISRPPTRLDPVDTGNLKRSCFLLRGVFLW